MARMEEVSGLLMINEIKKILDSWQKRGVPFYFIRDNNKPSVSLTLVVISGTMILVGLVGKASGLLGGIDMQSALYWHGMSLAVYAQRKWSKSGAIGDSLEKNTKIEN